MIFHRIFDGDNLDLGLLHAAQECVERRRLSGAGRTGVEDHAVGLLNFAIENIHQIFIEAECFDR